MQQAGEGGSQSQYGEMTAAAAATATTITQQPVESASPISSRPPASVTSNLDELIKLSGGGDEDTLGGGGDEGDRAGGMTSGNRWPRQETLALLKIRSDMDAIFRDATIKGPLWEDVSRKLAELGYRRSAKKCKEKFENVHKYYKRTKEGRAGRQDGKSYKFFSQLEALHSSTSTSSATTSNVSASLQMPVTTVTTTSTNTKTVTLDVAPVSIGIPMPVSSSVRIPPPPVTSIPMSSSIFPPPDLSATISVSAAAANLNVNVPGSATTPAPPTNTTIPISFSSNSSSSSPETEDDDDDDDINFAVHPSNTTTGSSRKRKRQSSSSSSTNRMMDFFEGLMKQVMQKQEIMQQRFLEVIEKREQDRMIREEAWKRQEMARLAREHELMAQERAISASRDAAIIAFLQKITGQTIQLPPAAPPPAPASVVVAPAVHFPAPAPSPAPTVLVSHIPQSSSLPQERRDQHHRHQSQNPDPAKQPQQVHHHQPAASTSLPSDVLMAIPEQQVPPQEVGSSGNLEATSSRWPKVEVLALIKLRSGLEPRYQEAGPKGPLWEEISAGMQRMGYKRSAKRCKEKWENINKYFKKVKESNKKRPEDAKTCPYFHELDALYQRKIIGGGTTSSSQNRPEDQRQQESIKLDPIPAANPPESSNIPAAIMPAPQVLNQASESENKNVAGVDTQASDISLSGSIFGEGNGSGASKKPEDIVKELMNQQGMQQQQQHQQRQPSSVVEDFDKNEEHNIDSDSDNLDQDEDIDDNDEDGDEESEEERKMAYKVEFQRQNANASNGGGNAPSFLAMVQ